MSFLARILGGQARRERLDPLYRAVVERARDPLWYRDGGVPDSVDGRFDMIAAVLALVLIRLEASADGRRDTVLLTELFIDDMDGTLRQIGIGDLVVGKHVGRMMGALGGRLAAFRAALAQGDLAPTVERNIFRGSPPSPEKVALVADGLRGFYRELEALSDEQLLAGELPRP